MLYTQGVKGVCIRAKYLLQDLIMLHSLYLIYTDPHF